MGKRHKTLEYKYFHKTHYIKSLETEFNIENFKRDYEKQFNIMYDIFKTLILLNNILFADSDRTIDDKITDLEVELENCLYGNLDNTSNKYKYSVREIKDLLDKHTRYLFNKFIEWYEYLSNINTLGVIEKEIEEEMKKLERVNFDYIIDKNILYRKNKDSKQSIYISKFFKYNLDTNFLENYLTGFYNHHIVNIDKNTLTNEICLIYNLVSYAHNGIIKQIYSYKDIDIEDIDYNLTNVSYDLDDLFEVYFKRYLQLKFNNIDIPKINEEVGKDVSKLLMYFSIFCNDDFNLGNIDLARIVQNYDLYFFLMNMNKIIKNEISIKNNNSMLLKILEKLTNAFNLIKQNDFESALNIVSEIINDKDNKEIYIRVS